MRVLLCLFLLGLLTGCSATDSGVDAPPDGRETSLKALWMD